MRFFEAHKNYYARDDGTQTGELANFADAVRHLKSLYGRTPARDFSPKKLTAVREAMILAGLARTTINPRVRRIVKVFKWAVSEELVPADVHHGLKSVSGLKRGRSQAKETDPVKPAPEADVDAVKPFVPRQVWAMIESQRLTGMRPDEVCQIRTCDIDTSGRVWVYTLETHKGFDRRFPRPGK
jgi:integrase